jgi:hypothetical protein
MYKMYTITVFISVLRTLKDHLKITTLKDHLKRKYQLKDQKISAQNIKITKDLVILLKLVVKFTEMTI